MAIQTTNIADFEKHIRLLGLYSGQSVAVHSKLISFGRIEGKAETVYRALRNVVGPLGTLVFPAYTLNLGSNDVYDPIETPSHAMGALSEYVRSLPGVIRSDCPMHGHIGIGPLAEKIVKVDPSKPIGPESSFSAMCDANFSLLLLGCDFQDGATFVHHVEAEVGVPYRSWLQLPRTRRNSQGHLVALTCDYYGHVISGQYENNLWPVQDQMEKCQKMRTEAAPFGKSYFMSMGDLRDCVTGLLRTNPTALVIPTQGDL